MNAISKFAKTLLVFAVISLAAVGCHSSSTAVGTGTSGGGIGGAGNKGPFQVGSMVTAYQLNADGSRSATKLTTTVTDSLGTYAFANIPWTGMTEVEITGKYFDENTGTVSQSNGTASALVNLFSVTTGTVSSNNVNPNAASSIAAQVAKQTLLTTPATDNSVIEAVLQASNQQTAAALGLPITLDSGQAIDLSALNVTKTSDSTFGKANKKLLAISAALLDVTSNTAAGTPSLDSFVADLATDINAGKILGATSSSNSSSNLDITAAFSTATTKAKTNAVSIAQNITKVIEDVNANAVAGATPAVVDTTLATDLVISAGEVEAASTTILRGFAMSGNTLNIGAASFTVAESGVTTLTTGTALVTNVVVGFTFKDYTNAAGDGPGAAKTSLATLTFSLNATATNDSRQVSGDLFPVNVTTDGAGGVALSIPTGATLTFGGTDSTGAVVVGSDSNIAATLIQSNANVVSIDLNALLTTIQNKVKAKSAVFDVLTKAGTFDFNFGVGGLNVGSENPAANGMLSLFPTSDIVAGRGISGSITTQ